MNTPTKRSIAFGKRLQKARTEKGISQRQLEELLHCGQASVSFWESGKKYPRPESVLRIAVALNVKAGWLLFGDKEQQTK